MTKYFTDPSLKRIYENLIIVYEMLNTISSSGKCKLKVKRDIITHTNG